MKPKQESQLRVAWHGPLTIEKLARRYQLTCSGVSKFWQREKEAGRLPSDQARPHFADKTTLPCAIADRVIFGEDSEADDFETSERIAEQSEYYNRRGCDHFLEALQRHHGAELWRTNDDVDRRLLRREADPFYAPGPAECSVIAQKRDRTVTILADGLR